MENKIDRMWCFFTRHFSDHRLMFRYLIAGGLGAFVNIVSMYIFSTVFYMWYILSAIFAFLISLVVTFFLQKMWTFTDKKLGSTHVWRQAGFYILSSISFLVLNILMLYVLVDFLKIWYVFAQFLSLGTVAFGSFLFNKVVTFRKVEVMF